MQQGTIHICSKREEVGQGKSVHLLFFLISLSCLKAYKRGGCVSKLPNLSVRTFWMVPKFDERKTKRIKKENDVERF